MGASPKLVSFLIGVTVVISLSCYFAWKNHKYSLPVVLKKCRKTKNIAFIKSHKVGGTTVQNVIQRFGEVNKLVMAIPRTHHIFNKNFHNLVKIPKGLKYNMFFNHISYYNRTRLDKFLPSDTTYMTIVREPLSQLQSAFYYYKYKWRFDYLSAISDDENPLRQYLSNPGQYDPPDLKDCFTNNRMSYDLGLEEKALRNGDIAAIELWLNRLDTQLDLIFIMEYFHESMILLKRRFCWETKDVLFIIKNEGPYKKRFPLTPADIKMYNRRFLPDVMLYNYSVARFQKELSKQSADFEEEVAVFRNIEKETTHYCLAAYKPAVLLLSNFTVKKTKFNPTFDVTPWDCELMMLTEVEFLRRSRGKQKDLVFMKSLLQQDKTLQRPYWV